MKLNGILYIKASVLKFVSYCCFNMNPGGDIPMLAYVTKSKKGSFCEYRSTDYVIQK